MTAQHILQLAQMVGLSCTELTADGDEKVLSSILITQVLADFGFISELDTQLETERKQFWLRALPPIIIVDEFATVEFDLHLPIEFVTEDLIWEIRRQQQVVDSGVFTPVEWTLNGLYHLHDMEMQSYHISLNQPIAMGDYQFVILDQGSEEPLGETRLLSPPTKLTSVMFANISNKVEPLLTTDALLNGLFDAAIASLMLTTPLILETSAQKLSLLESHFASLLTHDELQMEMVLATAEKYTVSLAAYLTAYEHKLDVGICSRRDTLTADWQDEHSPRRDFYLWLLHIASERMKSHKMNTSLCSLDFVCTTNNSDSFCQWLLADYQLDNCMLMDTAETIIGKGINSYQLRQDHYAAFGHLIDYMAANSMGLVLNQPLAIMQQWLTVAEQGIWQNHEFNELLNIILMGCERYGSVCYYQPDVQLPEELTQYLEDKGILALT